MRFHARIEGLRYEKSSEILTISRDYFRLRKPLESRLYELARKCCGQNAKRYVHKHGRAS